MVNRIFTFIESQQLTPTEFADKIGVSRASISSIKTGRTQPTLTLVEKIKQHFPDVDVNWLIFGTGEAPVEVIKEEAKEENTLPFADVESDVVAEQSPSTADKYEAVYIAESPRKVENIAAVGDRIPEEVKSSTKSVKKVILLYDDGSFEEFNR